MGRNALGTCSSAQNFDQIRANCTVNRPLLVHFYLDRGIVDMLTALVCVLILVPFLHVEGQLTLTNHGSNRSFTYESLSQFLQGQTWTTTEATTGTLGACSMFLKLLGENCPEILEIATSCSKPDGNQLITGTISANPLPATSVIPDVAVCSVASVALNTTGTSKIFFETLPNSFSSTQIINQAPGINNITKIQDAALASQSFSLNITGNYIQPQGPWEVGISLQPIHSRSACGATVAATATSAFPGYLLATISPPAGIDGCNLILARVSRAGVAAIGPGISLSNVIRPVIVARPSITQIAPSTVFYLSGASITITGSNLPLDLSEIPSVSLTAVGPQCSGTSKCSISSTNSTTVICSADILSLKVPPEGCQLNATVERLGVTSISSFIGFDLKFMKTTSFFEEISANASAAAMVALILIAAIIMLAFYIKLRVDSARFKRAVAAARAARLANMSNGITPRVHMSPSKSAENVSKSAQATKSDTANGKISKTKK